MTNDHRAPAPPHCAVRHEAGAAGAHLNGAARRSAEGCRADAYVAQVAVRRADPAPAGTAGPTPAEPTGVGHRRHGGESHPAEDVRTLRPGGRRRVPCPARNSTPRPQRTGTDRRAAAGPIGRLGGSWPITPTER